MKLVPAKNIRERFIDAEEALRANLQYTIEKLMITKGVTRAQLAVALECTRSNITQLLSEDGNPQLDSIARIFSALDDECDFRSKSLDQLSSSPESNSSYDLWSRDLVRQSEILFDSEATKNIAPQPRRVSRAKTPKSNFDLDHWGEAFVVAGRYKGLHKVAENENEIYSLRAVSEA